MNATNTVIGILTGTPGIEKDGNAYSKVRTDARKTLRIDARADGVSIELTEYRYDTNRTAGTSILITRKEWDALKKLIAETGGEI